MIDHAFGTTSFLFLFEFLTTANFSRRGFLPQGRISRSQHVEFYPRISSYFQPPTSCSLIRDDADTSSSPSTSQSFTEKIVEGYLVGLPVGKFVRSGDSVSIKPHYCMTHDNSWPVAQKLFFIGAAKIQGNRQLVMTLDHDVQNKNETNLRKYPNIHELVKRMGVESYGAGRGIGHHFLVEEGYTWPRILTVASDSHSNMYGGISCLGTQLLERTQQRYWPPGKYGGRFF